MQTIQALTGMQEENAVRTYTEEEKLILAAKKSPEKFSVLYEKYYAQILKFVYQRVVTKDDAYDITQQVFLQAMLSLPKYELRGFPFTSWLYRIAINELNPFLERTKSNAGLTCRNIT